MQKRSAWSLCSRRRRLDYAAIGNRSAAALCDQPVQLLLQRLEIGNFPLDLSQMLLGDLIDRFARSRPVVREVEQRTDLFQGKTQIASAANKAQAVQMGVLVGTIVAARASRRG